MIDTFHEKHNCRIQTVGADKGYFAKPFLTALVQRRITPHIAPKTTGRETIHQRVRQQVRDEAYLMGWLLNLKRLATLLPSPA